MPKGILYVESQPNSPEEAEAFHTWYEGTHLKEVTAIEGVVSARRFAVLGDDGPFIAIYELDADDLAAVQARISGAFKDGRISPQVGVRTDPPPRVMFCRETAVYVP
ncbi:hypothetical protein [Spirillospora sp. NPDC047279]|uniref:hypothetical protein n=1 Tax=Spirillospora sp. NPDC047279 TaxID=3155478 RepID=UPI0033FD0533